MTAWLLVTASRKHRVGHTDRIIREALTEAGQHLGRDTALIHGDEGNREHTRGGDRIAAAIWRSWGLKDEPFPADWDGPCRPDHLWVPCPPKNHRLPHQYRPGTYCPTAGNRRNQQMVNVLVALKNRGDRTLVLSLPLPGARGTRDCHTRARRAGLEVWPRSDPTVALTLETQET